MEGKIIAIIIIAITAVYQYILARSIFDDKKHH